MGATRDSARPAPELARRYRVEHRRVRLGSGSDVYELAQSAVRSWGMFRIDWLELCWPDAAIEPGSAVGVLVGAAGVFSLSACRIVYVVDEAGAAARFGFAYGTLPDHVGCGEERFSVEWNQVDDSVWYDLFRFSRPNGILPRTGYPLMRAIQRRFARASARAMQQAVAAIP